MSRFKIINKLDEGHIFDLMQDVSKAKLGPMPEVLLSERKIIVFAVTGMKFAVSVIRAHPIYKKMKFAVVMFRAHPIYKKIKLAIFMIRVHPFSRWIYAVFFMAF